MEPKEGDMDFNQPPEMAEGEYPTLPSKGRKPSDVPEDRNVQIAKMLADTEPSKLKGLSKISRMAVKPMANSYIRSMFIANIGYRRPIDLREQKVNTILELLRSVNADWPDRMLMLAKYEQEKHEVSSMEDDLD